MQVLRVDFKLLENELCVLTAPAPWAAQAPANAMLFTQLAATAHLLQPLTPGCISITSLSQQRCYSPRQSVPACYWEHCISGPSITVLLAASCPRAKRRMHVLAGSVWNLQPHHTDKTCTGSALESLNTSRNSSLPPSHVAFLTLLLTNSTCFPARAAF